MGGRMRAHRIVILGATGFVGRSVCLRLAAGGHQLILLTRRRESHREFLVLPGVQVVEANVHDPRELRRELEGCDAAVNLVGILNESRLDSFERVHVELPRNLVEACRQANVPRLLHMSALHATPDGASRYLQSKGRGEQVVHEAESASLRVTSFRPSVIFGAQDRFTNRFAQLLRRVPAVFPLACAQARLQPVHVEDVARAFACALDDDSTFGQRYNLCGPDILTLQEIVTMIARQLGLRRRIVPLNDALSRLQAAVLQFAPGKPFTPDNYRSLQVPSVCDAPFPAELGDKPGRLGDILPTYLRLLA
jgi:uncharacterized protein YbjT (DUF2867 family)